MNRQSFLLKLVFILFVCIVIFAAKLFFIKKNIDLEILADVQTKNLSLEEPKTDSIQVADEKTAPSIQSTVKIGDAVIAVEVARTSSERGRGLSGHPGLKADEGLLFIFENQGKFGFWMKDMFFSIDIIWINEQGRIVYIKKNATPESFPEVFTPTTNVKYVLEVLAGFSDKNYILVGDSVEFSIVR